MPDNEDKTESHLCGEQEKEPGKGRRCHGGQDGEVTGKQRSVQSKGRSSITIVLRRLSAPCSAMK